MKTSLVFDMAALRKSKNSSCDLRSLDDRIKFRIMLETVVLRHEMFAQMSFIALGITSAVNGP